MRDFASTRNSKRKSTRYETAWPARKTTGVQCGQRSQEPDGRAYWRVWGLMCGHNLSTGSVGMFLPNLQSLLEEAASPTAFAESKLAILSTIWLYPSTSTHDWCDTGTWFKSGLPWSGWTGLKRWATLQVHYGKIQKSLL